MKQLRWVVITALAACGDGGSATPDAAVDARTMCAPKMAPLAPGMHQLYLNFEGQTLLMGMTDDSAANIAQFLVQPSITVPAYGPNLSATTRQGRIDLIVGYVQTALAPYSVDVVTTRPASGQYMMAVIGGLSENFGYQAGIASIAGQSCRPRHNAIGLEFDIDTFTAVDVANTVLSDVTVLAGLGLSTRHNDCANRTELYDQGLICSFDATSPTATMNNCGYTPTQNELQLLMDAFGCRD